MPATDRARLFVEILEPALRQAAGIARALEGRVVNRPKADEESAVKAALTIADSAAQEALLVPLLEAFSGARLSAEEDTPSVAGFADAGEEHVVIDPIDGTFHFYLGGQGPYAVMAGLAREGRYQAALVALPREGLFFSACRNGPAATARAAGAARAANARADGERVLVSHDLPPPAWSALRARGLEPAPAAGGAIAVAPLLPGVRAGLRIATGAPGGISIRGRIGLLIARMAGAHVEDADGEPFPDDLDTHADALLVAADPADLELLREALRAAD